MSTKLYHLTAYQSTNVVAVLKLEKPLGKNDVYGVYFIKLELEVSDEKSYGIDLSIISIL